MQDDSRRPLLAGEGRRQSRTHKSQCAGSARVGRRIAAVAVRSSTVAAAATHLVSHLLKTLPLFGRENFLQALVGLSAYLGDARLRLFVKRLQLRARVAEYLLHLRFLIRAQLQAIEHLHEVVMVWAVDRPGVNPRAIRIERERA